MRFAQKLHSQKEMETNRIKFYIRFAIIEEDKKVNKMAKIEEYSNEYHNSIFESKPKIGIEPKQYEFECPCGYIWIDFKNQGCAMCSEKDGITAKQYEIPQPKNFNRK